MRHRVERQLRALWSRRPRSRAPDRVELADVRVRLEHYLRAIHGRTLRIEPTGGARRGATRGRTSGTRSRSGASLLSESATDVIRLPASLAPSADGTTAFEQYRCLAVQHAERIVRATAEGAASLSSDLERDLFEIAEAVSVDHAITASQPGLSKAIAAGRERAMRGRIARSGATEVEHRVEKLARAAFARHASGPALPDAPVPVAEGVEGSAAWARRAAAELTRGVAGRAAASYRRIPPLGLWGTTIVGEAIAGRGAAPADQPDAAMPEAKPARSRSRRRLPTAGVPDMLEAREDPSGEGGPQAGVAPSAAQPLPGAPPTDDPAGVETDEPAPDDPVGTRGAAERGSRGGNATATNPPGEVHRYPEWDAYAKGYHQEDSIVRVSTPAVAADQADDILGARHAVLVRQVRDRFAQLQAHRQRLQRQPDGDEIDLEAWVTACSDLAAGQNPDDRLYATVRVTRRALAILLLIDVSASTRAQIDAEHRVIDVERIAALLAAEAFDALGDAYAILAFASDGRADVRVSAIKRFSETNSALTGQRLSALQPSNATRLGAALRHATAELALRPESHRLLLVLSDGRPNDRDNYVDEDYAVEDSRRAVAEARAAGVTPYCITVDPEEPQEYMEHIFGEHGFRALAETAHLPEVLLRAVQGLVRR